MKRRRLVAPRVPEAGGVISTKHDSSCFNSGDCPDGFVFDVISTLNQLPVEPQVTSDFLEPSSLSLASVQFPIYTCDSFSTTSLFEFADPSRQFEFSLISTNPSVHWDDVARNIRITAELECNGGKALPTASLRSSSSFKPHPSGNISYITLSPAWWSHASSFTIVGLYFAGQLIKTPLLPATIKVVEVNHVPSKVNQLSMSTRFGNLSGVVSAVVNGCSTEESNNKVCIMNVLPS